MLKDPRLTVTKPFVPPIDEFLPYLEQMMQSRVLTNSGPIHDEFEKALCDYLGTKHICLLSSGTLALIIALRSLNLKGEVITTPFTSVATIQAIYWNNLKPVFIDINKSDFNINVSKIEQAVTPETCAILPVHIFGNPCDVDEIDKIAQRFDLKVIYDAAHCFGVQHKNEPVVNFGDLSVLSFHATKVFNTIEGGAIICHDEAQKNHINHLKNTGLDNRHMLAGYGLNAKMNELQAAFGLVQLKHVDQAIEQRKKALKLYRELLNEIVGLRMVPEIPGIKYNYGFFPVLFDPLEFGATRDKVMESMESQNIFPRKYFHPLVSDFDEFSHFKTFDLRVAREVAENILCLPLFHDIAEEEIVRVVNCLIEINRICPE